MAIQRTSREAKCALNLIGDKRHILKSTSVTYVVRYFFFLKNHASCNFTNKASAPQIKIPRSTPDLKNLKDFKDKLLDYLAKNSTGLTISYLREYANLNQDIDLMSKIIALQTQHQEYLDAKVTGAILIRRGKK